MLAGFHTQAFVRLGCAETLSAVRNTRRRRRSDWPLLLMRVPPVHHEGRTVKPFAEKARIGFVFQPFGHVTVLVRDLIIDIDETLQDAQVSQAGE